MRDRPDSTPDLPGLEVPALILHGADDQLIPVTEAEAMAAAMPHAKLVVVPDAGHLLNLEQPDFFNDAVRDFLEIFYVGIKKAPSGCPDGAHEEGFRLAQGVHPVEQIDHAVGVAPLVVVPATAS